MSDLEKELLFKVEHLSYLLMELIRKNELKYDSEVDEKATESTLIKLKERFPNSEIIDAKNGIFYFRVGDRK